MRQRFGSTRLLRGMSAGVLQMQYGNWWSAFDRGPSPQEIPGIGAARCACAVRSFMHAQNANLPTHFIRQVNEVTIEVKEFRVPNHEPLSGAVHGDVIPLEWLVRFVRAGSLDRRLKAGELTLEAMGYPRGTTVQTGDPLPWPWVECTTKFDPRGDLHLSDKEAQLLAKLTPEQFAAVRALVLTESELTRREYRKVGFDTPDGKKEALLAHDGMIVLGDVFGTQDENRIIGLSSGHPYDKDLIRNYLIQIGWKKELDAAKAAHPGKKDLWPQYPTLPEDLVGLVSQRYVEVALRYAGVQVLH